MKSPFFGTHPLTVLDVKRLAGACNGCGMCCTGEWEGKTYKCLHLEITRSVGQPNATRCRVYDKRFDGMPVPLVDETTNQVFTLGWCWKDSEEETAAIISRGIGRGCSLVLVDKESS